MKPMVALVFALGLCCAGCVESPAAAATQPEPDALLVRVFLEDGQAVLRMGGLVDSVAVVPFEGTLEAVLMPRDGAGWSPVVIRLDVHPSDFVEAVLPYVETSVALPGGSPGDRVTLAAEAQLEGGSLIRGSYVTIFK